MAQRTGLSTLHRVARELCRYIGLFTPIIQRLYGDNAALMAALSAANAACGVLVTEIGDVLEYGD